MCDNQPLQWPYLTAMSSLISSDTRSPSRIALERSCVYLVNQSGLFVFSVLKRFCISIAFYRRIKPGGLPLELLTEQNLSSESDEERDDLSSSLLRLRDFRLDPSSAPPQTSELCKANILKRAHDGQNLLYARKNQKPSLDLSASRAYFQLRPVSDNFSSNSSRLTQLIEDKTDSTPRFSEYARFEALVSRIHTTFLFNKSILQPNEPNSRIINVVYAHQFHLYPPPTLAVCVKESALMAEFIGLCCHIFARLNANAKAYVLLSLFTFCILNAASSLQADARVLLAVFGRRLLRF